MNILNMNQVAELLGIGRTTAFELLHTDGCPSFRVGRRLLVSEKALLEWCAAGGAEKLGRDKGEEVERNE